MAQISTITKQTITVDITQGRIITRNCPEYKEIIEFLTATKIIAGDVHTDWRSILCCIDYKHGTNQLSIQSIKFITEPRSYRHIYAVQLSYNTINNNKQCVVVIVDTVEDC